MHRASEKQFADFSGTRPHLVDPRTGEVIVVGVLGASGLIYAEATPSVRPQPDFSWEDRLLSA